MEKSEIEEIVGNSGSFGKLNAILYYKALQSHFEKDYSYVVGVLQPEEIKCSLFDLDKLEMKDIHDLVPGREVGNSVIRIILLKGREEVILEYYNNQVIVEHLFRPNDLNVVKGHAVFDKYFNGITDFTLVIGHELSLNINGYDSSLMENVSDSSLHPILVLKCHDGKCIVNEYASIRGAVNENKTTVMREYLKMLRLDSKIYTM